MSFNLVLEPVPPGYEYLKHGDRILGSDLTLDRKLKWKRVSKVCPECIGDKIDEDEAFGPLAVIRKAK